MLQAFLQACDSSSCVVCYHVEEIRYDLFVPVILQEEDYRSDGVLEFMIELGVHGFSTARNGNGCGDSGSGSAYPWVPGKLWLEGQMC